jgi:hypothetical protein
MTDMQVMTVALCNMIGIFEAMDEAADLDPEDLAVVAYCKRVRDAGEAGDLAPIHAEIAADASRGSLRFDLQDGTILKRHVRKVRP